jgi:hypothetical protein
MGRNDMIVPPVTRFAFLKNWARHQRTGRIGERAHDVERCASAVSLLQGLVSNVEFQPEPDALVGHLQKKGPPRGGPQDQLKINSSFASPTLTL